MHSTCMSLALMPGSGPVMYGGQHVKVQHCLVRLFIQQVMSPTTYGDVWRCSTGATLPACSCDQAVPALVPTMPCTLPSWDQHQSRLHVHIHLCSMQASTSYVTFSRLSFASSPSIHRLE